MVGQVVWQGTSIIVTSIIVTSIIATSIIVTSIISGKRAMCLIVKRRHVV